MMHFLVYWLPCILFINGGGLSLGLIEADANMIVPASPCLDKERQALLSFKASLVYESGTPYDWEEEKRDCCRWVGVSCSNDSHRVIGLDLSGSINGGVVTGFSFTGKMSPSLAQLHHLQYLNLSQVDFQFNPIPDFLGSLSDLRHLDISSANLAGPIPHQLANLPNLLHLDLSHNFLNGCIPFSFGDSTSLTQLDLSRNQLGGSIPKSFENCSSLVQLNLSENLLNGSVPSFAGCRTFMKELILHHNSLQGGVPDVTGWSSLNTLSLGHNSINGTIPNFTRCLSLSTIDLSVNNLTGHLPISVGQLFCLKYLDVSFNSLDGVISDLHFLNVTFLTYLYMSHNKLTGHLPISVGQLSYLEYLDVSSNSLNSVISDLHFQNLTQLTYLDLSFNSFSLELGSTIPSSLDTIKLQSCMLGPSFPVWLETQTTFTYLDISSAGISHSIPSWFWDQLPPGLRFLNISSNEIKDVLPNITTDFVEYPGMDLSDNQFKGRVPPLPSKLAALNLSGNKLSGNLSFLCQFDEAITLIDLSSNSFTGTLPDCWSNLQKYLTILNLSDNNLSGRIPSSLGSLSQLSALYLRNNTFVGGLPKSLSKCTNLRFVDVGENNLSGTIPTWIGERLPELYVLVLRSNQFSGTLPKQVCWLYNLQLLDLSKNKLSGNIPQCVANLTAMIMKRLGDDDIADHLYSSYAVHEIPECTDFDMCTDFPAKPVKGNEGLFTDMALVAWKGIVREFGRTTLKLLKSIDLSNNNFSGILPNNITSLVELKCLNLSSNKLHGEIPKDIGQLKSLECLDLSRNEFSGSIPWSLSLVDSLGVLDLSNNNFSGKIPVGNGGKLQQFNSSSYSGNPLLHGPPLTRESGESDGKEDDEDEEESEVWKWYYMGMGVGFGVGFWGICGAIFLNRGCRHVLFAALSHVKDWIYVTTVVHFRKFIKRF